MTKTDTLKLRLGLTLPAFDSMAAFDALIGPTAHKGERSDHSIPFQDTTIGIITLAENDNGGVALYLRV